MPNFSSLQELEQYILSKLHVATEATVAPEIKTLESKNVKEIVYDNYIPVMYERDMLEGGLADESNMSHEIKVTGNSIGLTIDNHTLNNQDYNPYDKSPFEIAGLVEYGDNNGYGTYDYPYRNRDENVFIYLKPRPFIEQTRQDLENGKAKEFYIKGLRLQGLNAL